MITVISEQLVFSSLIHKNSQIPLSAFRYFFPLPQHFFRIFFPIKALFRGSFLILEAQGSAINFIHGLLLLSITKNYGIDTSF